MNGLKNAIGNAFNGVGNALTDAVTWVLPLLVRSTQQKD
jgi:hypothetical protein